MTGRTLGEGYFDDLYAKNPDPWDFQTSDYERAKYWASIEALGGRRYERGLEVGCSIGVFTRSLADVVDDLIAIDLSERALRAAKARNRDKPNVKFSKMAFPDEAPAGPFDLIVLSEVLYYFDNDDLGRSADIALERLSLGGDMLLVHWLGETDYPLTGDAAADGFIRRAAPQATTVLQTRHERYRLDLLRRRP